MKKFIIQIYKYLPLKFKKIIENLIKKVEGGEFWSVSLRKIYKDNYGMIIGNGTYGVFKQEKYKYIQFGNYCSIAKGLEYFPRNHPKEFSTMHPIFYNSDMGFVKESPIEYSKLYVGHDVWIGANVIITSKCNKIGNGAIIGAGSVVTKDVEPYTIVAGNPAKIIGKRFDDQEVIELLEKSKWYEMSLDELKKYSEYIENPKKFAEKIIEEKKIII